MRAKAKYYVELRGWTSEQDHRLKWHANYEAESRADAFRRARLDATGICHAPPAGVVRVLALVPA